jgi:formiminoglutamase
MHATPDMKQWQGRVDAAEGELGKRWHQVVQPFTEGGDGRGVALVGFACDAGIERNHGRTGARKGPAALRAALGNMPVHRCKDIADAGDVVCEPTGQSDGLEEAQQALAGVIDGILAGGRLPFALGGGHEIAWASFSGLARHLARREQSPRIGVINLDAHFDLRMADRASSGTPFRQIAEDCQARGWKFNYCCLGISRFANTDALFERARRFGVHWRLDEEMTSSRIQSTLDLVQAFIGQVDHVYFTTCLDVLPAHIAPGVSAPAPRGIELDVVEQVIDAVAGSGKLRLADIAELNPAFDIDQRTARVAARLVARIVETAGV